ncbi:GGDEF domain-containing protein [Arcobacter sp. YIC-310]|uniref:GGDEF domain-containing protein n=1 Tax=Arcobacter sp. YIC-310 TaxID=3376632 RepID=UPI003C263502
MKEENKFEAIVIFPWNKNFETGIKQVDEEHKTLIKLLNKLANSLTQDKTFEIEETFNELAKYADYHFKSEEAVWEKHLKDNVLINFHKKSHNSFLPKVLEIREKNKDKTLHETIEEILMFLIRWLAFHIIDEDKRLAYIIHSIKDGKQIDEAQLISDNQMGGSMRVLIDAILSMYDNISSKAIKLIRERKARIEAQRELQKINKELERLSITDQLTNLYNRRFFEELFQRELQKSKRNKNIFSVILFDIDYFKKLNDTYGHGKGDEALIKVAQCLKKVCKRPNDFVFRIGGEEFTIIITNEDAHTATNLAQLISKEIKALKIDNINSEVSAYLTISAGVISIKPTQYDTIESIMQQADKKLYQAKSLGRNIIID